MNEQISMRKLIGVAEAAEYTALSVHTVYTMVSQRRIPYVRVGRLVKFDLPMMDASIQENTVMLMTAETSRDGA